MRSSSKVSIICKTCGDAFKVVPSRIHKARYCSKICTRKKFKKQCPTCNRDFWTYPSYDCTYCSYECIDHSMDDATRVRISDKIKALHDKGHYGTAWKEKQRIANEARRGKPSWNANTALIKKCLHCKNSFRAIGKMGPFRKFCSMSCRTGAAAGNVDPDKLKYYNEVWRLTKKQPLACLPNFDKRGKARKGSDNYQLDHIISIHKGYLVGIAPEIIADISNLQMLPWKDNIQKHFNTIRNERFTNNSLEG